MTEQTTDHSYTSLSPVDQYHRLTSRLESIETPILLTIGIMGFLGACFSLAVFLRERSSPSDYFIYKIISACEAAQMLVLTIVRATSYLNCERSYACSFFWAHISICVMNACADIVDFLILFLCVERTWASLLPFAFKNANIRLLERSVAGFAFVFMIIISSFQAFEVRLEYDEEEERYRDQPSQFAKSKFYSVIITANTIRFYATALAISIATVCSIFGFWRTARRGKTLTKNHDTKRELHLCCLQLCTAAPVVINHLLYAISLRFGNYAFSIDQTVPLHNETMVEDEAQMREKLRKAEIFQHLKTSANITDALAHASQFYVYLLFCMKIREEFLALWKKEKKHTPSDRKSQRSNAVEEAAMLNVVSEQNNVNVNCTDNNGGDYTLITPVSNNR